MPKLFETQGVLAKGVQGTLMTELKEKTGRVSVSGQFKIEEKQKATDDQGREVSVAGTVLTWFSTITDKTRERTIESMVLSGLTQEAAERIIALAEGGKTGKVPDKFGFGTKQVSLACEINEYDGKTFTRISWVNNPAGRKSRAADLEELDLGDDVPTVSAATAGSSGGKPQRGPDDPFA